MYSRTVFLALSRDSIVTQFKRKFTWVKSQMQSGHRDGGDFMPEKCLKKMFLVLFCFL